MSHVQNCKSVVDYVPIFIFDTDLDPNPETWSRKNYIQIGSQILTINPTVDYMARSFMSFMRGVDITRPLEGLV